MSALTQFFGGGSSAASTIDTQILLVSGGQGGTRTYYRNGPAGSCNYGFQHGAAGLVYYANQQLTPGITVPITVGAGGQNFTGACVCCSWQGTYSEICNFGTCGCASCFGNCVYMTINAIYCPYGCQVSPPGQFCWPCVRLTEATVTDTQGNQQALYGNGRYGNAVPGFSFNTYDAPYQVQSGAIKLDGEVTSKFKCSLPVTLSASYCNVNGIPSADSCVTDFYASVQQVASFCNSCQPQSCDVGEWWQSGLLRCFGRYLSDITGSLQLYGINAQSVSTGPCYPCINDCCFPRKFTFHPNSMMMTGTGVGRGAVACDGVCLSVLFTMCCYADPGTVIVKYPDEWGASSVTSPNVCNCSPQTPGYYTYRFLAPGSITLP